MTFTTEPSPLGRIVIPPHVPPGYALFYTTLDLSGRLDPHAARAITDFIRERFGIDSSLTTCTQVHGATVRVATPGAAWRECDSCDALWSTSPQTSLGIKVADCLPVSFIDPEHDVIADIHSGWRGTVQQIAAKTVRALRDATSFDPGVSLAYLGPAIRACCFEVGDEVVAEFEKSFGDVAAFVDRSRPRAHIDVAGLTHRVLRDAGFAEQNIFDSGLCTRCDGSIFHSFRRDGGRGGRNLAVVAH